MKPPRPIIISAVPPQIFPRRKTGEWYALQIGRYTGKARIQALRAGIKKMGGTVLDAYQPHPMTVRRLIESAQPRFAFTCGEHWTEDRARAELNAARVPVLVADLGYFHRAKGPHDATGYNQLGVGSLCWVPPVDVPGDRWAALGIPDALPPVSARENICLVLGQVAGDTQHKMTAASLHAWFADRTRDLRAAGWRIIYRPHPSMRGAEPAATWADAVHTNAYATLAEGIADAARVVTYNSTAGLDAILSGVPVTCAPCAHYAAVAEYGSGAVTLARTMQHIHRLAYAQWTCDELASGEALKFIQGFLRI